MNLNDLFTEEKVRLDPKCWTGKKIGNPKTKMKGGTRVNNCVPAESVNEMDKSQTPPGRDGSNDSDASKKEYTAKASTPEKVAKDAEKILNKELNKKQGVAEEYELAGVGVAYELGRRAYKERKTARDNPYSATKEARKNDEWAKGLERGKHDANDAKHFRSSVREQGVEEDLTRRGFLRGLGAAAVAGAAGSALAGTDDLEFPNRVQKLHSDMMEKNPRYAKEHEALGIALARGFIGAAAENNKRWYQKTAELLQKYGVKVNEGVAEDQLDEKSVSQAQFRTMAAAAHNPKFAKKVGIKQSVAKEFNQADKGSNYKKLPDRTNEGGDVFMANIKDTPEYKAGFATGKLPVPHPEGTQQYASYYKGVIDKASPTLNKVGEGELDEGWKSALGAAALAGTMAMGAGGASARVMPGDDPSINRLTGKPIATQQATDTAPAKAEAPQGFSKEYLQKAANPDRFGRFLISVEKAQELLKQMNEGVAEEGERGRGRPMAGDWDPTSGKVGRVEKTSTGVRHHADPSRYGGTENEPELDALNKNAINAMDRALDVKWDRESKRYFSPIKVDETKPKEKEADYGDDYQDMVARVKKLAGLGPLKTVYDPAKRVYRNVPTAVQPKK